MKRNEKIKSKFSKAFSLNNFMLEEEIEMLLHYHFENKQKIKKNTGPITSNIEYFFISDIIDSLKDEFGPFEFRTAHIFQTDTPHILHNDDDFDLPNLYKAFVIPLQKVSIEPCGDPKLLVFDQSYFEGPSKFVFGEEEKDFKVYYNKIVTSNEDVQDKDFSGIDSKTRMLIPHIKDKWLDGLTVESVLDWKIGDVLVFDSAKIHCASDFRKDGILEKIGLSIFTCLP